MKWKPRTGGRRFDLWLCTYTVLCLAQVGGAQSFQQVTVLDPAQAAPAGGSGDSRMPILSPDARYALFVSTANNLALVTNGQFIPPRLPANLNVFLRDRTNATTALVSVNASGTAGGNGNSWPMALSTNGQFALFESMASDLAPDDTNRSTDVFLRDVASGRTLLVSAATNGLSGSAFSDSAAMTPDARYVVFVSAANNLVSGDTNGVADVFLRDMQTSTTMLVSAGILSSNSGCRSPDISADGRYIAFYGSLTNNIGTVGSAIYIRDQMLGSTVWASADARGILGTNVVFAFNQALSADGQYLAYEAKTARATNGVILRYNAVSGTTDIVHTNAAAPVSGFEDARSLDMSPDGRFVTFVANTNGVTGSTTCVVLWDAATGNTSLISGGATGAVVSNSVCYWPSVDPTGRFVAFLSTATNLVPNPLVGDYHLYLRDTLVGTTTLLDADTNGVGSPVSAAAPPCFNSDFSVVAFECADANLVPDDRNHASDVFLLDLNTGGREMISVHNPGLSSATPNGISTTTGTSVSSNGQWIAFASEADDLVTNDQNGCRDVFVRNVSGGTTMLVSVGIHGAGADNASFDPSISPDGRYVAFASRADDLVPGDNNHALDVFVRDMQTGTTTLVSVNTNGTGPANYDSYAPVVSTGGRYVLFRSRATNLAPGNFSSMSENLFLADLQAHIIYPLTTSGDLFDLKLNCLAAMTPDGHRAIFGVPTGFVYVWDSATAARIYTNRTVSSTFPYGGLGISADGKRIAFAQFNGGGALLAADVDNQSTWLVETNSGTAQYFTPVLSADGHFLACMKRVPAGTTNLVYLYDLVAKTNVLLCQNDRVNSAATGISDSPQITAEGRFVVYRSDATNIVAGDTNDLPDVFLYDRLAASTVLLSGSAQGFSSGNNRSLPPILSGDGSTLLFSTWASDITPNDFNEANDLFIGSLPASVRPVPISLALLPAAPGQNPWLTWTTTSGVNYHAQFKNNLDDQVWQNLLGGVICCGTQAFFQDPSTPSPHRFYRIVGF